MKGFKSFQLFYPDSSHPPRNWEKTTDLTGVAAVHPPCPLPMGAAAERPPCPLLASRRAMSASTLAPKAPPAAATASASAASACCPASTCEEGGRHDGEEGKMGKRRRPWGER